jgi:hypothetical protein
VAVGARANFVGKRAIFFAWGLAKSGGRVYNIVLE